MNINRRQIVRIMRFILLFLLSYWIINFGMTHLPDFIRSIEKKQK